MTTLNINGRNLSVDAASDTPLLWAIREQLQMTGTKFGCGAGLCGACTVHVNGEAVRSCQTMVGDVAGKKITTIEGLAAGHGDDPVGSDRVPDAGIEIAGRSQRLVGAEQTRNGGVTERKARGGGADEERAAAEIGRLGCHRLDMLIHVGLRSLPEADAVRISVAARIIAFWIRE